MNSEELNRRSNELNYSFYIPAHWNFIYVLAVHRSTNELLNVERELENCTALMKIFHR